MDSIYQAYVALSLGALLPIYLGAHASVKPPIVRKKRASADTEESDSEDEEEVDRLTSEDAYWFPILGSAVLAGLFFVFKYFDKSLINLILFIYFSLLGTFALTRLLTSILRSSSPSLYASAHKYRFRLTKNTAEVLWSLKFTGWQVGLGLVSAVASGVERWGKWWWLSDAIALAFAYNAVGVLKLDTFKTGSIFLGGLFVYDIWWVFGSHHAFGESVMVNVAKNFDAPIKITWPKSLTALVADKDPGFTMLGLGDIVIPGVFVALCLRYDYHRALPSKFSSPRPKLDPAAKYAKPYFYTCLASYVVGLSMTMAVMHFFEAAQPALLYLSPACVGSVSLLAAIKGDSKNFWSWEDGQDDEKKDSAGASGEKPEPNVTKDTKDPAETPKQAETANTAVAPAPSPPSAPKLSGSGASSAATATDEDWTSGGVSEGASIAGTPNKTGKKKKAKK